MQRPMAKADSDPSAQMDRIKTEPCAIQRARTDSTVTDPCVGKTAQMDSETTGPIAQNLDPTDEA